MIFESIEKKLCQSVNETGQEFIVVRLFINSYFVLTQNLSNKNVKL